MSDLEKEVEAAQENIVGLFSQIGEMKDRIEELEEDLRKERAERDSMEDEVKMALGAAEAADNGARADGGTSKQKKARFISRDVVIKQTAESMNTGPRNVHGDRNIQMGSVTNKEVQQMAEPQVTLEWQTVDRAWKNLVRRWDAFMVDSSGDKKRLTIRSLEHVDESLALLVEKSVDEEGIANAVVGGGRE